MTINNNFWTMTTNKAKDSAEISIYGTIGTSWWEESVSAAQFARDLRALGSDVKDITVRINSAGGSVFDGLAIRSTLKSHAANVHVIVDGLAASIASIIAMAGDKITMAAGSMMMIHNPMSSIQMGDASDFREAADFLDKVRDSLVSVYASRTNISEKDLIAMMDAETWMSAEEALDQGFIDEVEAGSTVTAMMHGTVAMVNGVSMNFERFINPPQLPQAKSEPRLWPVLNNQSPGGARPLNLEELKAQHPALVAEIAKAGAAEERLRIQALDKLSAPGTADLVAKAKYETFESAANTALAIIELQNQRRQRAGQERNEDADSSGVNNVESAQGDEEDLNSEKDDSKKQIEAKGSKIADVINKMRGGVK
ncbi:head maturation protease, ClpP-related [Paenibacillus anseongense]|uniref:head maturation protease, ClpP-related n=1 Tax=Paenibacillus anseongense TaxID=2682845 RepID=UPI002DB8BC6E|nr:head maturation protease, ClpP-related [Paenibacillus anseongense]MEC0269067.1 Clp protease ClpP [Paenibacillus anseongense]